MLETDSDQCLVVRIGGGAQASVYVFIYLFITPINKKVLSLQTVFFVPLPLPASLPSKKIARIGQKERP